MSTFQACFPPRVDAVLTASCVLPGTPLALLVSYFIFSFFLYIVVPRAYCTLLAAIREKASSHHSPFSPHQAAVNSALWYTYMSVQTFVVLTIVTEAIASIKPNVQSRRARRKALKEGFPELDGDANIEKCPRIDLVLVAYLPNEREIILKQMRYALTQIDYPMERITYNM